MLQFDFSTKGSWQKNLRAYDKTTLAVLVLLPVLALLAGKWDAITLRFGLIHAAAIALILALARAETRLPQGLRFVRDWYPIVLITFFFSEVGRAVNVFFPFWLEPYLIQSDYALFGMHAYEYLAPRFTPLLTEVFAFAYWAYYPMIPLVAAAFYFSKKGNAGGLTPTFEQVMNRLCAILYLCYICLLLFPARGPHHALQVTIAELTSGGFFFNFVLAVQQRSSIIGAAFPSAHAAAAWTMLLVLRHDFKKTFWALLPLVLLLSLSTFVLQYHYWVDAVAGMLLAFVLEGGMTWHENKLKRAEQKRSGAARPRTRGVPITPPQ
ncbi:MAG: phosphatase PAP2 family protein [candidate division KSB1 bacterium]